MGRFWPIADVAMTKPTLVIGRVFGKKTNLNLNINSACNIDASAKILMSRRQKNFYIKEKYFFLSSHLQMEQLGKSQEKIQL